MICGGEGSDVLPKKCHSLNPDLGTWEQTDMEHDRIFAGSSLYGEDDDMLISGGITMDESETTETTEIVGKGESEMREIS